LFYLEYRVTPATSHPRAAQFGEGLACCWIDWPTLREADRAARRHISAQHWTVIEREHADRVTEADFADDPDRLAYYEQALTDREVLVFHESPRYPVYLIVARAERRDPAEVAEVYYFVCNEALMAEDDDPYDPDFWSGERVQAARDAAHEAIAEQGWKLVAVVEERPIGRGDLPDDLVPFYDDAEEDGACLVFVHDEAGAGPEG
jgi:hypothetical protein